MSKKFSITVPDETYQDITRLAQRKGETAAGLAALFVELSVEDARKRGELPQDADSTEALNAWNRFLDEIEKGNFYTDKQISVLAVQVDRAVRSLYRIQACYKKEGDTAVEK